MFAYSRRDGGTTFLGKSVGRIYWTDLGYGERQASMSRRKIKIHRGGNRKKIRFTGIIWVKNPTRRILFYRSAGKSYEVPSLYIDTLDSAAWCRLLAPLHSAHPSFIPPWLLLILFVTKIAGFTFTRTARIFFFFFKRQLFYFTLYKYIILWLYIVHVLQRKLEWHLQIANRYS